MSGILGEKERAPLGFFLKGMAALAALFLVTLLMLPIREGNVISGWFWLSGRLQTAAPPRGGWFSKLTGRG